MVDKIRFKKNNGWGGARPGAGGNLRKDGSVIVKDTYNTEYAEQAKKLCMMGATDYELANWFGVALATIRNWRNFHEDFADACRIGKGAADDRVVRSLYERCVGYDFDEVKIWVNYDKDARSWSKCREVVRKHIPPDVEGAFRWLRLRNKEWRETNNFLVPLNGEVVSALEELGRRYNNLLDSSSDSRMIEGEKVENE